MNETLTGLENSTGDAGFECDPNIEDCELPHPLQFASAHFFLWFLTFINGGTPILYWFAFLKPEIEEGTTTAQELLNKNYFWFELSIPFIIWCHAALYGIPALIGFFTWFGVPMMDSAYEFWMNYMINYCGSIVHGIGSFFLLGGVGQWRANAIITR